VNTDGAVNTSPRDGAVASIKILGSVGWRHASVFMFQILCSLLSETQIITKESQSLFWTLHDKDKCRHETV
jgi:hypothetical protein